MFNGNRGGNDAEDDEADEYFDDAGDVGYLPADHVSYTFSKNKIITNLYSMIALDGQIASCFN